MGENRTLKTLSLLLGQFVFLHLVDLYMELDASVLVHICLESQHPLGALLPPLISFSVRYIL